MGAWGYGSFENDTALDWLVDFEGEGADTVIVALEDVANAVLFLASSASAMVTGDSLKVDGGWTAV